MRDYADEGKAVVAMDRTLTARAPPLELLLKT